MEFTGLTKGPITKVEIARELRKHGALVGPDIMWIRIEKRARSRWGAETHFRVKGTESDALERAIHGWFQEPGEAPFPQGTLLHFSYRTDGERVTEARMHPDLDAELTEAAEGVGC